MNALVGPDRDCRAARERRETFHVGTLEGLLEEQEPGFPRRLQVTPRRLIREAAIGVGADRQVRPQRLAHRKRSRNLDIDRLDADLELEKADALTGLGLRLGNVLIRRRIADEPHGPYLVAQRTAHEIDQRQSGW